MTAGPVPWFSIALLSGAALAYEVLLTRLFSIVHWHHLVGMIISLALFGYGASGTFLSLFQRFLSRHFRAAYLSNALVFALSTVLCFALAQRVPINPMAVAWERAQLGYLALVYLLCALPFFAIANCIGLALYRFREINHRLYAMDLLGAGLGALAAMMLIYLLHPEWALLVVTAIALCGCVLAAAELGWDAPRLIGLTLTLALILAGIATTGLQRVNSADYKDISQALQASGARIDSRTSGPLGTVTVIANEQVPVRYAPGLSLAAGSVPGRQLALFVDGDMSGAITGMEDGQAPEFVMALPSALPFELVPVADALILGAGNGLPALQALANGVRHITVVEENSALVSLLGERYRDWSGTLFEQPGISLQVAEPRAFVMSTDSRFDLIVLDLLGGGGVGGLQAQSETYLYTQEALRAYLERLNDDGLLAITRWLQIPPRESLKLLATARRALQQLGVKDPVARLVMIRSWKTFTLLVGRRAFSEQQIARVRDFSKRHSFDLVHVPGMQAQEASRYHLLDQPLFYQGALAVLGDHSLDFAADYPFLIEPASDDRPYFFRFSRWQNLPELLNLPAGTGFGQVEWGYWMAVATLLQAGLLSLVLILLPLHRLTKSTPHPRVAGSVFIYFGSIGVAFLLVELAFIQRFQLFIGQPFGTIAVALAGFLVFAGLGSAVSRMGMQQNDSARLRRRLTGSVAIIVILALAYVAVLPGLLDSLIGLPLAAKVLLVTALIAPLAFAMGMPFPLGLALIQQRAPNLIPWAWGINGCASVIAAAGASLLAMEIGFSGLVIVAAVFYGLLPWVFGPEQPK